MVDRVSKPSLLVTGVAGFIGFHLAQRLLQEGFKVIGIDSLNDYYDVGLKESRLDLLRPSDSFSFVQGDIADYEIVEETFSSFRPTLVFHLAAQAGVRYSLENSFAYTESNLVGFHNVLEASRRFDVGHFMYASSSSVYGGNSSVPFRESDRVDEPVSYYAATKRSNELVASCYAHLYNLPSTGLRFFTVYGPYGRPDMAYFSFADRYFAGSPIYLFNNGDETNDLQRDFTYIDDVIESVFRLMASPPAGEMPHQLVNIGGSRPEKLGSFVNYLERALSLATSQSVEFTKIFEPLKPGDVPLTYADPSVLETLTNFVPQVSLADGLQRFAEWYVDYYGV